MSDPVPIEIEAEIDGTSYQVLAATIVRRADEIPVATVELLHAQAGPTLSANVDAPPPEPESVIGLELKLKMQRQDGASITEFVGKVVEVSLVGEDSDVPFTRVVAMPSAWRTTKRSDCRVFQEKTTDAIVKDVLERAGADQMEWQLAESYSPRLYCIQHRETDWDFITRLLAEDGIGFTIEKDKVRFTDGNLGPIDGESTLPYTDEFGFDTSRDCVEKLEQRLAVRSDKVTLRDYDFERPDFELAAQSEGIDDGAKTLETYVFPARTNDDGVAKHYAKVLCESLQGDRNLVTGQTQALHMAPLRTFTVTGHPYQPLNQEYCLLEVVHRYRGSRWGEDAGAEVGAGCTFVAMPTAAGPHRPARKEPRALPGYDSAVVVGQSGREIHPDEHARVKAQFLWDRVGDKTDKASCFMRTTQAPLGGGLLTPRVGWEVTVDCIEGDPDQPIITGRMYTAKAPPPYALPKHKTRTTIQTATSPGGGSVNEIRFDDAKGSEEMFMNASKNMAQSAGNNATDTVGGNETRSIGANQKIDVTGAVSWVTGTQVWSIGSNQTLGIDTYMVDKNGGAHSLSIGGNRDLKVGGDHRCLVAGASTLDVAGMQVDLVVGNVTDTTPATFKDTIGAALIEIAGGGRNVTCKARTESVGAVKAVLATGGRGVEVGGAMTHKVAGAILIKTKADLDDNSKGALKDIAGGAQIVKATNVTFTAETLLTVVCGGSTLTLTPGSITLAGASVKLDGVAPHVAGMIKDN
jgi:type VI secretion system secreted protein VgrG